MPRKLESMNYDFQLALLRLEQTHMKMSGDSYRRRQTHDEYHAKYMKEIKDLRELVKFMSEY